jgi:acyl-CoA synthetase (NDP forming)
MKGSLKMKTEIESKQLLARYGIATTNPTLATSATMAADVVRRLGQACALKVV